MKGAHHPVQLVALALSVGACVEPEHALEFRIDFADPALRERARIVEVTLKRGGCEGAPLFRTEVTRRDQGAAPGPLARGRYGFAARAQDASCLWFASGCSEATLPSGSALTVVLRATKNTVFDERCGEPAGADPSMDSGSEVLADASISGLDAAAEVTRDGSVSAPPDATAGDGGSTDGGAPFDETAPKCSASPDDVVACLDFEGDLADDSPQEHYATGADAKYEAGLSGQAIRVQGTRVTLHDHPALQLGPAFTIELWLRADSLINLDNEQTESSLLLDKDQQYNLGIEPSGDLVAAVYAAERDDRVVRAESSDVQVGVFTYVAFVYQDGMATIYQDGSARTSEQLDVTPFAGTGEALHIGSGSPNVTRPYDGLIDALRIWKRGLDESEVCRNAGRKWLGDACL